MHTQKSQTATEYLIILAIVIIIAVVVIGVIGGIPGISNSISSPSVANIGNKITISQVTYGTIGASLQITNNLPNRVQIINVYLEDTQTNMSKDLPLILEAGETRRIESFSESVFTPGQTMQDRVNITWKDLKTNAVYKNNPEEYTIEQKVGNNMVLLRNYSYVFVSSTFQTGDMGGLSGADTICNNLARSAGIKRTNRNDEWVAYLSTSAIDAPDRLKEIRVPIVLLNGTIIAFNKSDMYISKGGNYLYHGITLTERQTVVSSGNSGQVQTGTLADGTASGNTCSDWTASAVVSRQMGHAHQKGSGWTEFSTLSCGGIGGQRLIYCFEIY